MRAFLTDPENGGSLCVMDIQRSVSGFDPKQNAAVLEFHNEQGKCLVLVMRQHEADTLNIATRALCEAFGAMTEGVDA